MQNSRVQTGLARVQGARFVKCDSTWATRESGEQTITKGIGITLAKFSHIQNFLIFKCRLQFRYTRSLWISFAFIAGESFCFGDDN